MHTDPHQGQAPPQAAEQDRLYLEAMLRTMRQPLIVLDGSLVVERANAAFYATFEVDEAETEGRKIYDLGNGQWDIPELRRLLEDILPNRGEVKDYRVEHEFEQIGRRVMLVNAYRMGQESRTDSILLSIEDITAEERVRRQVEAQKEYAEKIIDASRDALLILDLDLRVQTANDTFYEKFRVSPEDTVGRLVYELGNNQWDIPELHDLLENVLPDNNAFDDFEVEHDFADIGRRTMVLNARRVDHIQFILLAIEDKTEVRNASERLEESEARFRAFVSATSDVMYRMGPDWSELRELDGRGFLADTSKTDPTWLDRYIPPEDHAEVTARIAEAIRTRSVFELEHRVIRADGTLGWTLSRAVPILDEDGNITEWFGTASDVTDRREAQEKQRESEERIRSFFNAIDEGYCLARMVVDEAGKPVDYEFLEINPLFEEMTGFEDPVGKTALSLVPDLEPFWIETYARVGLGRQSLRFEQRSDAMDRDFDVYATPVDPHGCFVLVFRDITEKKKSQAALRESEERFRQFAENSADALWIIDAASGQLEYLSPAFERIWGESRERMMADIGRWADFLHPDDRDQALKAMDHPLAGEVYQHSYRIIRPCDGAIRTISDTGFPIPDENGRTRRVGGVAQDVTEQRQAEADLRKSQEQLQLALDAGRLGVWDWDILTDTVEWSENHFRLEGYDVGEVEPSYEAWLRRVHPGDREETARMIEEARKSHTPYRHEFRILLPDRSVRWLSAQGAFYYDEDGKPVRMVGVMHDTTERKTDQEQLRIMVAELQHRTRNLITVISSLARQLMRKTDTPEAFVEKFSEQLMALSRVQGLLSRSGRVPVTIGAVVEQELGAVGIGDDPDRLQTGGPDVLLRRSKVQMLALCLHELATNAKKYGAFAGPRGKLSVTWDFEEGGDHDWVRLDWVESGLNLSDEARNSARQGYGRELIEKALPYAAGAETRFDLQADGLKCTILLPLKSQGPTRVAG